MSKSPLSQIDAALEAWAATNPSEISKVMMLAYLMGLLAALEKHGDLPPEAVKEVVFALRRHTA